MTAAVTATQPTTKTIPNKLPWRRAIEPSENFRSTKAIPHRYLDTCQADKQNPPAICKRTLELCLTRIKMALESGNEDCAIAAIRTAFSNGLCKTAPHDPKMLPNSEPLASTVLGGTPDNPESAATVRLVEMLERYEIYTVGDVRRLGISGLQTIPMFGAHSIKQVADAVGLTIDTPIPRTGR